MNCRFIGLGDKTVAFNQSKNNSVGNWASKGIHNVVLKILTDKLPIGSQVIDLACGPGALAQRLFDKGFDVTAVDNFPEVFQLHGIIPFIKTDLENEWQEIPGVVDAICAVEIIEHVENPYLFIRRCFKKLKPGGLLIISTPNAGLYSSRLLFLHTSNFELYSPKSFSSKTKTDEENILPGHINVFSEWMVRENLKRAGFYEIIYFKSNNVLQGLFPVPLRPWNFIRHIYYKIFGLFLSLVMNSHIKHDLYSKNIIFLARKPKINEI